jgi:hypothetical protein
MNKVTLALTLSTFSLALTSIYLWKQLDAERDRAQTAATQHKDAEARLAKLDHEQHPAAAARNATTASSPPSVAQAAPVAAQSSSANSDIDEMDLHNVRYQKRWQEARRRMLADPGERELLKAQARSEARGANSDLARELQLSGVEFDRLIELLAELDLKLADLYNRSDDVRADIASESQALRDQLTQDIASLLGYEKAQQYAAFQDSRAVRTQVRRLRGRLGEGDGLTDEQDQRLIATLQKDRLTFNEEMQRRVPKERVSGSRTTWDGGIFMADSASAVPAQEQFIKQIEEFRKRQRQAAAEILTARQLNVFAQMQEEMLSEDRLDARIMTLVDQSD